MSLLFNNKYRIPSSRLQTWNYGNAGMYFVTICTANREFYFGDIDVDIQMQLSPIGKIAEIEWIKTIELRPDMNLELGEFVVMPNHFHGIIIINENQFNSGDGYKSAVTTYARKNNIPFNWQPRFHDHIIRSTDEYYRISNYIVKNPVQWHRDRFFKK